MTILVLNQDIQCHFFYNLIPGIAKGPKRLNVFKEVSDQLALARLLIRFYIVCVYEINFYKTW